MAVTEKIKAQADGAAWDPSGPCPACKDIIQMYLPPDRGVGGPIAYPALLLHYEQKHSGIMPPAAPQHDEIDAKGNGTGRRLTDTWEVEPPAPEGWRPLDKELLKKQQPQPAGVWPPLRAAKSSPE